MSRRTAKLGVIVLLLLLIACAVAWRWNAHAPRATREPLPPIPVVPATAQPKLVRIASLPPLKDRSFAKPVIAADHEGQIVVAKAMTEQEVRLVQWHSDKVQGWTSPAFLNSVTQAEPFEGDPWLETDRQGQFSLVYLDAPLDLTKGLGLALRRSVDSGCTWSEAESICQMADRPVMGVSPNGEHWVIAASLSEERANASQEPLNGNDPRLNEKVAARFRHSAGIFSSKFQGRDWKRLPGPWDDTHAIPFSAVIDEGGRIATSWIAARGLALRGEPADVRSLVVSTQDEGITWVETELVSNLQPDRTHPFNGERFPVLVLGSEKRLHVAYVESRAAGLSVRHSDDWTQWTDPVRLSQDGAEEVRLPAIAALGPMVHVIWAERKGETWRLYYCGSRDRGETWSDRILLKSPHDNPTPEKDTGFHPTSDDDQFCIRDDGAGTVHAVWSSRGKRSESRVWYAAIEWRVD